MSDALRDEYGRYIKGHNGRTTHGRSRTSEYNTWRAMIIRCELPCHREYSRYGGRGIAVCPEWRSSFSKFLADVGHRPSGEHTIDRKDNNGPYSPENCRWATRKEQQRNRSNNCLLTHLGFTMTASEWAEKIGISRTTICQRLKRGWTVVDTLSLSLVEHGHTHYQTAAGHTQPQEKK